MNTFMPNIANKYEDYSEYFSNKKNYFSYDSDSYTSSISRDIEHNSFNNMKILNVDNYIFFKSLIKIEKSHINPISLFKEKQFESENKNDLDKKNDFKENFTFHLKKHIENESLEFGLISKTTLFVKEFLLENKDETLSILSSLLLSNFNDIKFVYSILHTISHLDYDLIYPGGVLMAFTASRHKDIEIQDFAIQCFEMWNNKDSLGYLNMIIIDTPWLDEYFKKVITYIENSEDSNE